MPSVRVRKGRERTYLPIEEAGQAHARSGTLEVPPVSPDTRRARSRTVTSYLSRTSGRTSSPPPISPTSLNVPGNPYGARSESPADVRGSIVGDYVLRNNGRTVRLRKSEQALLAAEQAGASTSMQRNNRNSMHSYGDERPSVDVQLSRGDLEGQIGSALSLHRDDRGRDYDEHHHDEIVDHLDVIDPQVGTLTNLSNAANSIFLPPLSIYSRRPVMTLPNTRERTTQRESRHDDELDEHVAQVLKKRNKFRRIGRGIWDFVKTPIGFCTALYGFLCAFWGAAIVIFLAKIINLHNHDLQNFWIEISSQVTNGLFTATGIGLIPWRAIDTYRMAKIWHYKRLTRQLRKQKGIADLVDEDDLPDPAYDPEYVHVLSDKQQDELHYQQQKFMLSQTWYRPHATDTHKAFPINTALIICLLIDGNSFFQCFLCGCMWGLNRFQRPAWTTGTLIPASFSCALAAAYFIFKGNNNTKKTTEVEGKLREALDMEKDGLMNAHLVEKDGFTEVVRGKTPPPGAETMIIPESKATLGPPGRDLSTPQAEIQAPDLLAVPSGPSSHENSTQATTSKKAPIIP